MYTLRRSLLQTSLPRSSHLLERERETGIHSFIYLSHPIETAGSDLQAPSHSVALPKKKKASKRVHELHKCNYMYMYMYFTTIPLPTCTVYLALELQLPTVHAGSVHELSSSIQLEVSHVFIAGKVSQMGSVSPLSSYSLSLARSERLSLEVDGKVRTKGTESIT